MKKVDSELNRHERIMAKIENAKTVKDLPKVGKKDIQAYISKMINMDYNCTNADQFGYLAEKVINKGTFNDEDIKETLFAYLKYNCFVDHLYGVEGSENLFNRIVNSGRIDFILIEMQAIRDKYSELNELELYENHKKVMKDISLAFYPYELPKVCMSDLNKEIYKTINNNSFMKINQRSFTIKFISSEYIFSEQPDYRFISCLAQNMFKPEELTPENQVKMKEEIIAALRTNSKIQYLADEIKAKKARLLEIYKMDHEYTMGDIKNAKRISQLPEGISESTLNKYLFGNSTIYSKDNRFKSEDFKEITRLLLAGEKYNGEAIVKELNRIADLRYPGKPGTARDLFEKLTVLPKTKYLIDEINAYKKKEKELKTYNDKNVNIYLLRNDKNKIGGKFINIYTSRSDEVYDLDKMLPKSLPIDDVELVMQEKYDPTFKIGGGIILYKDETIGNINAYKIDDGSIGISPEEKEKMDRINDLDASIKEKEERISELDKNIDEKENLYKVIAKRLAYTISESRQKASVLTQELMDSIDDIERSLFDDEKKRS